MKQISVALLLLVLAPRLLFASQPTESEMDRAAGKWIELFVEHNGGWNDSTSARISEVQRFAVRGTSFGTVYQIQPAGFLVVPASFDVYPVFAFSLHGSWSAPSDSTSPGLHLRHTLTHAVFASLSRAPDPRARAAWARLLRQDKDDEDLPTFTPQIKTAQLMTGIAWHQFQPYDLACPSLGVCSQRYNGGQGFDGHCVVGCVASSLGRLLRFHAYPDSGEGTNAYEWADTTDLACAPKDTILSADFRGRIDWSLLPPDCSSCTPADSAALADFCYKVGVSLDMNYGRIQSNVTPTPSPLLNNWRYRDGINFSTFGQADAWDIARTEINAHRPLWAGTDTLGHQVCADGWAYDDNNVPWLSRNDDSGFELWLPFTAWNDTVAEGFHYGITPRRQTDFVVNHNGTGGDYANIQAAIDDSLTVRQGSRIVLGDGVFTGAGNVDVDFRGRDLTICSRADNPDSSIIDCQGSNSNRHRGFYLHSKESAAATIQGITIRDGYEGPSDAGGGILCANYATPVITNCVFDHNTAGSGGGLAATGHARPRLEQDLLEHNRSGTGAALYAANVSDPWLLGCTLAGDTCTGATNQSAVYATTSSKVHVFQSIIAGTVGGKDVICGFNSIIHLSCCDVYGNAGGDWTGCISAQLSQNGNMHADPRFCSGSYYLHYGSPCGVGNSGDCGQIGALPYCHGSALVRPDSTGDFKNIAAAVANVCDGDTILLANGTFQHDGNRDLFISKILTIRSQSGNPDSCKVDCGGSPSGYHRFATLEGADVLQDLTLTGGYLGGGDPYGGCILVRTGGATLVDCVLERNSATVAGGGGAIAAFLGCVVSLRQSRVQANGGYAGGACLLAAGTSLQATNTTFWGNRSGAGSAGGGAVQILGAQAHFDRCTFFADTSLNASGAGAIYLGSDAVAEIDSTIIDSCVCANGPVEPCGGNGGSATASCSDIFGCGGDWGGCLWGQGPGKGSSNLDSDPLLDDPRAGSFCLDEGSPCWGGSCGQIGAYGLCPDKRLTNQPREVTLRVIGSNPSRQPVVQFTVPTAQAGHQIDLAVYDAAGRRIRSLFHGPGAIGVHTIHWDARTGFGASAASGVYFLRLRVAGGPAKAQRLVVLR